MAVVRRPLALAGVFVASFLAMALPADAQGDPSAPPLVVGTNKAYCHTTEDGMGIWMNTLLDDGPGTTYNVFGEPAFVDPALGIGFDPVQDEDFAIRIPLSPSTQALVLSGTVNVQIFLGSGAYGGGQGSVSTSLAVDGTDIGTGVAQDHMMEPHNSNAGGTGPYEELTWTFEVPSTTVPAGSLLEWVVSGHIDFGNNIFLSCYETRGRSNIDLPVTSLSGGGGADGSGSTNTTDTNSTGSSTVSVSNSTSITKTSTSKTSTTSASTSRSTTSGNATGNGTADDKDSPAPPLAFAGLAVLVAAVAVRRKLR
jgi:MYXO-CTERM domain-containing protein